MKVKRSLVLMVTLAILSFVLIFSVMAGEVGREQGDAVIGDANGDGVVNGLDLILIRQYIAFYDYDTNTPGVELAANADCNGDGEIGLYDIMELRDYLTNTDYGDDETETETEVPIEPECAHIVGSSVYNEATGLYDQICSECGAELTSPINLLLAPEQIAGYYSTGANLGFDSGAIVDENGESFFRLTSTKSSASIYFYPYHGINDTVVTGEYAIIKYRVSEDASSLENWSVFSGTVVRDAGGDGDRVLGTHPAVRDDGKWHIAVIKLDNTSDKTRFVADENGDYYTNYVRLGFNSAAVGSTVDIAYFGLTSELESIAALTEGEDFNTDVFCTHYQAYRYKNTSAHEYVCYICGYTQEMSHTLEGDMVYNAEGKNYLGSCSACGGSGSSPLNVYVDAEMINKYATNTIQSGYGIANRKSSEYFAATEDDIAFTRITPTKNDAWTYFYYYVDLDCENVTGQYVIIKFRLPESTSNSTIASYVGSVTSPNNVAASGENFTLAKMAGDGKWVVAAYDMSKIAHYGANDDGTYSAKYLRIDFYLADYIDVAFIGVCDNPDAFEPNVGDAVCTHDLYNYEVTMNDHAKIDCAVCGEAVTDTTAASHTWSASVYNEKLGGYVMSCGDCRKTAFVDGNSELNCFFDPTVIQKAETKTSSSLHFAGSELATDDNGSLFIRFTGGNNNTPYFSLVSKSVNAGTTTDAGHFLIFKYRYTAGSTTSAILYVSSSTTSASANNRVNISVVADGEWHIAIVDLQNTGTTDVFEGETAILLRLDLFAWSTPTATQSVDIAYFAISDDIDELRAFDDDYDTYGLVGSAELKSATKNIATEKVDEEHNGMSYVTLTGSGDKNYTQITKSDNIFMGTGKYVAMLYRKDSSTSFVSQCRMYFSKNNATDKSYLAPYISDGKWHLTVFDMSGDDFYCDGMAKTVRFDWFNFTSQTISVDVAYVKFFHTLDDAYAFYGEYVDKYLGQDSCDHLVTEWQFGFDDDPDTDTFKEYAVCCHCGKQTNEGRDVEFGVTLHKVTDSMGTYPSEYNGTIGSAESEILAFNSTNYSDIYPSGGLTVATGDDISIAGYLDILIDIDSIWFKITDADGTVVSAWKQCRGELNEGKFAAYADFDGVSGEGLTVTFAAVPAGLAEEFGDRYLPIVSVENVSVDADAVKQASFKASGDIGPLMDDLLATDHVLQETVMFINYGDTKTLLYNIDKVISVKSYDGTVTYEEGRDYIVVDGKLSIPEGSTMPCITDAVYYDENGKISTYVDGVEKKIIYGEGPAITKWQVIVEYEHSDEWNGYVQDNQSDYFANFIEKLMNGEDVTVIFYGDSITAGANSSFMHGYAQKQYGYALLLTHAFADAFGYTVQYVNTRHMADNMGNVPESDYVGGTRGTITYINTAVGGWNSNKGRINVEKHVTDYIANYGCDLFVCAFGMNDLDATASITRSNVKDIVDPVLLAAPDTSVLLVSTMFYNNTATTAEAKNSLIIEQDGALKSLAADYRAAGFECGITSMSLMSESVLTRKAFADYTGNNTNHPNDFFGRVYAQTLFRTIIGYENIYN